MADGVLIRGTGLNNGASNLWLELEHRNSPDLRIDEGFRSRADVHRVGVFSPSSRNRNGKGVYVVK